MNEEEINRKRSDGKRLVLSTQLTGDLVRNDNIQNFRGQRSSNKLIYLQSAHCSPAIFKG